MRSGNVVSGKWVVVASWGNIYSSGRIGLPVNGRKWYNDGRECQDSEWGVITNVEEREECRLLGGRR